MRIYARTLAGLLLLHASMQHCALHPLLSSAAAHALSSTSRTRIRTPSRPTHQGATAGASNKTEDLAAGKALLKKMDAPRADAG